METSDEINNVIVISDLHCGCRLGLFPPYGMRMDEGSIVKPSRLQKKLWAMWEHFWNEWVPIVTHHERFAVVVNGDTTDGVHHNSVTQVSHNLVDQKRIAATILSPVVEACNGKFFMLRGTESHVGKSGQNEEDLAESLGAKPDEDGRYARYELWLRLQGGLIHFNHHIGTTGRTHYETSAPMAELGEMYTTSGRWRLDPPDICVRSHRHRHVEVRVPTKRGYGIVFVTPAWQLRTPFSFRTAGGRVTEPQIGGSLIRAGDEDLYTRHKVWELSRSKEEKI